MKIIINKNRLNITPSSFLRKAGYNYIQDRKMGKESFVRRLGRNFYPRLHIYIKENNNNLIFDLHLDQKQASYSGTHMHNAEYDGAVVEDEINRLKSLLLADIQSLSNQVDLKKSPLEEIGQGELPENKTKKISWFKNIFTRNRLIAK